MEPLLPVLDGAVVDTPGIRALPRETPLATAPLVPPGASPAEELGSLVGWAAAVFYLAESDVNPGVTSYWDALHYITTSLSVGYANIFPMTPLGKTVGSVVMMLGPALSARVLDTPREREPAGVAPLDLSPVVERLDAILQALQTQNSARSNPQP
jgi:voltage-gated potassium channel